MHHNERGQVIEVLLPFLGVVVLLSNWMVPARALEMTPCARDADDNYLIESYDAISGNLLPEVQYISRMAGVRAPVWGKEPSAVQDACTSGYRAKVDADLKVIEKRFQSAIEEMNRGKDENGQSIGGRRNSGCSSIDAGINNLMKWTRQDQMVCTDQALYIQRSFRGFLKKECSSQMKVGWGIAHYGTDGVFGGLTGEMESTPAALVRAALNGDVLPHQRSVIYDERLENFYWVDSWTCRFEPLTSKEKDLFLYYQEREAKKSDPKASAGDRLRAAVSCRKKPDDATMIRAAQAAQKQGKSFCRYDDSAASSI